MVFGGYQPQPVLSGRCVRFTVREIEPVALVSCNSPPLFEMNAPGFLQAVGVDIGVTGRLTMRMSLDARLLENRARDGSR